jgi:hypothetical protein
MFLNQRYLCCPSSADSRSSVITAHLPLSLNNRRLSSS